MELPEWVKRHRLRMGLSRPQLAEASGISRATIAAIEDGKRPNGVEELTIAKLERVFGIKAGMWRYEGTATGVFSIGQPDRRYAPVDDDGNESRDPTCIPVYSTVKAGRPSEAVTGTILFQVHRGLVRVDDPQAFGLVIDGDSMLPDYPHGSIVILSPALIFTDNAPCYIQFGAARGFGSTFKRVVDAGPDWLLIADNPNFEPRTDRVPKGDVLRVIPAAKRVVDAI